MTDTALKVAAELAGIPPERCSRCGCDESRALALSVGSNFQHYAHEFAVGPVEYCCWSNPADNYACTCSLTAYAPYGLPR